MFRLPRLLDPPVAPLGLAPQGGGVVYTKQNSVGYLPPSSGIAACPSRATDTAGLSPAGLQPCRLLHVPGRRRRGRMVVAAERRKPASRSDRRTAGAQAQRHLLPVPESPAA